MIAYFDTSAIVPLLIAEPGSELSQRLWDDADDVVTTQPSYVEAAAALAQALRLARLTEQSYGSAIRVLDVLWDEFAVLAVDDQIVRRAATLACTCALRGYDAVHCAAAEQCDDGDLVVVAGDQRLLDTCGSLGMATADVNHARHLAD